jgi:Tfp pilus assembly protein PilN
MLDLLFGFPQLLEILMTGMTISMTIYSTTSKDQAAWMHLLRKLELLILCRAHLLTW